MGRPRIGATVMTPAERQRRHRAKLAAYVERVLDLADRNQNERPDVSRRAVLSNCSRTIRRYNTR
jgi:hypothetical protein